MADPKLPDINPELAALPYDNDVKRQIYDAFYSDNDEVSKQILESLPIPGKLKNDFYERRHTSAPAGPATTQQPTTEGILDRAGKNLPRSGANFIKGFGSILADVTTMGLGQIDLNSPSIVKPGRLAQSVNNVVDATGKAFKQGGVGAAVDAGSQQGVSEAFTPIIGFTKHIASRLASPMESFAEDPVGMVADVASVALPALASKPGMAAINKAKSAAGIKPSPPPMPVHKGLTTRLEELAAKTRRKQTAPPQVAVKPPRGPAAESAAVFESGVRPVSREGVVRIEDLKAKISERQAGGPAKTTEPPSRGPAAESAAVFESGVRPVSREGVVRIEDLKASTKARAAEVRIKENKIKQQLSDSKSARQGKSVDELLSELEARSTPAVKEEVRQILNDMGGHDNKSLMKTPPPPGRARFVAEPDGIADMDPPFRPVDAEIVEPTTAKQLPAPKSVDQKALPAAAEVKQLPAPEQGQIDHAKIAAEVNSDTQIVHNLDRLSNEQLHDIIAQFKKDPAIDLSSPEFDPGAYEQSRRIRNTAQAVMRERAAGPTVGAERPLNYTPDSPVPQTKIVAGEEVPAVNPKSAVAINSKTKAALTKEPLVSPKSSVPVAQVPETPAVKPEPSKAMIEPPAKPVVKPPVVKASSSPPKTAKPPHPVPVPAKPKAPEAAQAELGVPAPPVAEPKPATPTVTAKADVVEPVSSPIPQVLKQGHGFKEVPVSNGKASYRNGSIDVKPGERAFSREIDGDTDIYTVREYGGKVNVYDLEDKVVASYPSGTAAENAIEQKFGRTVEPVKAPQVPAIPTKSSPIPKKAEKPVAEPVKADPPATSTDTPPNASREEFLKKLKELTDKMDDGETLSKAEMSEMKRLARGVEQVEVAAPVYKLKAAKGEKLMKPKVTKESAEIEIGKYDKETGDYPVKGKYTISKEGDHYVMIDPTRKRVGSYKAKTIEEAVDLALKD